MTIWRRWKRDHPLRLSSFWLQQQESSEKAMAPHSSTLAWRIPWMEEPGGLQSMGSWRVGHDWATSLSLSCIGEGNGNPLQCSCLENPRNGGAWWAAIYGVTQSRTRLKQLSSSSSSRNHATVNQNRGCRRWNKHVVIRILNSRAHKTELTRP